MLVICGYSCMSYYKAFKRNSECIRFVCKTFWRLGGGGKLCDFEKGQIVAYNKIGMSLQRTRHEIIRLKTVNINFLQNPVFMVLQNLPEDRKFIRNYLKVWLFERSQEMNDANGFWTPISVWTIIWTIERSRICKITSISSFNIFPWKSRFRFSEKCLKQLTNRYKIIY